MANAYINVYKNNPTAGSSDGTVVSTDGVYSAPITVTLNATNNESKTVKLAVRCEPGFETVGDTTISDVGDTYDRWKLCLTENGTYTDSITISSVIDDTNTIFYAKAFSSQAETPSTDRSVSLELTATVTTV